MKRIVFLLGTTLSVLALVACSSLDEQVETTESVKDSSIMEAVENSNLKLENAKAESSQPTETQEIVEEDRGENPTEDHMELLQAYEEAYANFKTINHRNEKLKDLMTEECIQMNGINVETGNALGSEGKVTAIYQNDQDEYAVLLDCIQNGSPIRILLLAKVEDNKIAEMTYNTLKREY